MESPERETLRSRLDPESFPPLNSPHCVQGVPPPAPLVFTPPKSNEESEIPANTAEEVSGKKVEVESEEPVVDYDEKLEEYKEKIERLYRLRDRMKDLKKRLEDGAVSPEEYEVEDRKTKAEVEVIVGRKEQQKETPKCSNCDGEFSPDHQCYS